MPSNALRKDITVRAMGANGISLRCTRTSEISNFVKNCNLAEKKQMRKELNIWHKDTNFILRKVAKRQDGMYRDLLKISRKKKQIKNLRENHFFDREELKRRLNTKLRNKKNQIPGVIKDTKPPQPFSPQQLSSRGEECIDGGIYVTKYLDNAVSLVSRSNGSQGEVHEPSVADLTQKNYVAMTSTEYHIDDVISAIGKANLDVSLGMLERNDRDKTGNNVTEQFDQRTSLPLRVKDSQANFSLAAFRRAKMKTLEGVEVVEEVLPFKKVQEHNSLSVTDLCDEIGQPSRGDEKSLSKKQQTMKNQADDDRVFPKVKRRKRRSRTKLIKSDPTKELLSRSTVEARPGKTYDITVYKKSESGDFEAEVTSWNTTVDVSKYFNLSSRRERLEREKLLEDARQKETQQRRRVNEFLEKLDRERDDDDGSRKQRSQDLDNARRTLQRRAEAIKLGPPKYGSGNVSTIPNYVRSYERPTIKKSANHRNLGTRSSWSFPSLVTLEMATANSRFNPTNGRKALSNVPDVFSHLVNINSDKYVLDAAIV